MQFKIIVVDPPWSYRNQKTGGSHKSGSAQKYPVMTLQQICDLPVAHIVDDNSVLFLWATVPLLPEAFEVMKAWGYRYKASLFWTKTKMGMGFWFRGQVEMCLLGVKGKVTAFRCQQPNIIHAPATKHSRKPKEFFELIEPIIKEFDLNPKIELFATEGRFGWHSWGHAVTGEKGLFEYWNELTRKY